MGHDHQSVAHDSRAERTPLAQRYLDEGVVARYEESRYRGGWRSLKYRMWLRVLERALDAVSDARTVADLPCGPGFLAELASRRFPLVIASDISPAMVRQSLVSRRSQRPSGGHSATAVCGWGLGLHNEPAIYGAFRSRGAQGVLV